MGKKKQAEPSKKAAPKKNQTVVEGLVAAVCTAHGAGSAMRLGSGKVVPTPSFSSGVLGLDIALGVGGYPYGRIVEIYGPEACLASHTHVHYELRTADGRRINHKGGTIRRLWERFHHEAASGDGRGKNRRVPADAEFFIASLNEDDRVFQNRIVDVVRVGLQQCFKLTTEGGHEIEATAEHRFYNGTQYVALKDVAPGDLVLMHTNTPYRKAVQCAPSRRAYLYVKHHPVAGTKVVHARLSRTEDVWGDYEYKRLARSRAVIEAKMNKLSLDEYVARLNAGGDLGELHFLSREDHVHHLDEDESNDMIENLAVINASAHSRLHALDRHNNLRYAATEDVVASIEPVGVCEVFDLNMTHPFNNFVANKFVVHNSGKTTLALHALASIQKLGGSAAFIDAEHAIDPTYAARLGVDFDNLVFSQPSSGEQALDIVETLTRTGDVKLIVVDSVAALVPQAELDGDMGAPHMGLHARLMSQALRKIAGLANKTGTTIMFINQLRMKIGVMFGSPEVTTGGNALKYYSSIRLDVRRRKQVQENLKPVGNQTLVKVIKNKHAPPFKEVDLEIIWGEGINIVHDLVNVAVEHSVVQLNGAWYSYGEQRLGQGANNAAEMLRTCPELRDEIDQKVREAAAL